jgi:hypothetical protein
VSDELDLGSGGTERDGRLKMRGVKTKLDCPCGEHIEGQDQDNLVAKVRCHLADKHPDLLEIYGREHILFMAY